jgi:hypothetical protein
VSGPVGGANWGGRGERARWERDHERDHERMKERLDRERHDMDGRVRKLERAVWTMSAILATTTVIGVINLVRDAAGVQ